MSEEKKKKGFWSWLGFGKKAEENIPEPVQAVEMDEKTAHDVAVEMAIEQANDLVSQEVEPDAGSPAEEGDAYTENGELEPVQTVDLNEKITNNERVEISVEKVNHASNQEVEPTHLPQVDECEIEIKSKSELAQAVEIDEKMANDPMSLDIAIEDDKTIETDVVEIKQIEAEEPHENAVSSSDTQEKPSEGGFFSRLIKGLIKTKQNIGSGFRHLFRGKKIDDELFEELEEQLLIADLGMPTTTKIINHLTQHATKAELRDAEQLYSKLKEELADVLKPVTQPLVIEAKKPYVILMVGVNGVGKTTTIGKLARKFQSEGKSVMLAAGDTFRAAAVEQLQVWGERNHIPVVAQATGADSASVIFDAMQSAAAKGIDVLIADTAGRLQNKNHLMDELKKIVRVMKKYDDSAPHEIMLTLDAGTGQNAISQAKLFNEAVGLTGITLTKLDGTAKGGVIFAIADQFKLPIRFIGVGEKIDDLRPFDAEEFIEALFSHEDE